MYFISVLIKKLDRYVGGGFAGFDGKRPRRFGVCDTNDLFAAENECKTGNVGMLLMVHPRQDWNRQQARS